jgi:hypothetical protein
MFVTDLYKHRNVLGRTVTELKKRHSYMGLEQNANVSETVSRIPSQFFGLLWTQGKIVTFSETVAMIPPQIK